MDRRLLLKMMGLATAGMVAVPAVVAALAPAMKKQRELWQPLGPIDQFELGTVTKAVVDVPRGDWSAMLREKGVYVWRPDERQVVVFSRDCTDLSCPVVWDPGSGWFFCPCHGGIFATDGRRMAGPPRRPLYRYANRVRDGVLEIDLNSLPPMT